MNQLLPQVEIVNLITPTAGAAGTSAINTAAIDMANFDGVLIVLSVGAVVAGAVTSAKIQVGATSTPITDVPNSTLTILDTDDDTLKVWDVRSPLLRYLRLALSRATQNATVSAIAIKYNAKSQPVAQAVANIIAGGALKLVSV